MREHRNDKLPTINDCDWRYDPPIYEIVVDIKVKRLRLEAQLPRRSHEGDAGYDITAAKIERYVESGVYKTKVYTGLAIEPPPGWYCEVYSRSSIAKTGGMLANAVGIIDGHYRGEIILVFNDITGNDATIYREGEKVAQLVLRELVNVTFTEVDELSSTTRGTGSFGSTGK